MSLRSNDLCPTCRGIYPGQGPDVLVCRCGSLWHPAVVDDLREVIHVLADLIRNPGPTDAEREAGAA